MRPNFPLNLLGVAAGDVVSDEFKLIIYTTVQRSHRRAGARYRILSSGSPPMPLDELKQTAEFSQGRKIDVKTVYGVYIFTERGSEGITMGVTNAMYNFCFEYQDPKKPYHLDGFVNPPGAVKGLGYY